MAAGSDDESGSVPVLRELLSDPSSGREKLPQLFDLLDAADPSVRVQGAWAVCLVVEACPDAVDAVARRLATRLAGEESDRDGQFEAELAFAYLRHRFEDNVTETLETAAKESAVEEFREHTQEDAAGFARSDYVGRSNVLSRDVGRTKIPERDESDPRNVYQNRQNDAEEPEGMKDISELLDTQVGDLDEQQRSAAQERRQRDSELERAASDAAIEDVTAESRFDELTIVAPGIDGRYTTVFRTRAVHGNSEEGIAINLFRVPDENTEQFAADVATKLENWAAIADNDAVVTLYDWAIEPSPWMATDYTVQTLYDKIDMSLDEALRDAVRLASTISYAHQRGVVHAGIDPYNVVYAGGFMRQRDRLLVKNFGLMDVMRQYFEPSTLLDPRYAAPEYYDRSYGEIDNATDIYHLGAVIYKLLTGRPPFEGNYSEVRTAVLSSAPPVPSDLNPEIPDALDDVIRKAMAKQKLTRYETVTQLVTDLERVTDE
ncbi:protein kinase [Halorientalis brevis]|uniref:Protein kinase n=1 Tax=Halorientalis brevis TaxID=1126241 RepID=A0ABD6CGL9_9EURY|nr:protein kinase [Halorientalis brevis]